MRKNKRQKFDKDKKEQITFYNTEIFFSIRMYLFYYVSSISDTVTSLERKLQSIPVNIA